MAHPGLTPLPPTVHHSSTPLTHAQAHEILTSFLALAELDPSLRPDAVLTERGPTSSSSAANPSLTLAHLGRIASGIRGERVGGGVVVEEEEVGAEEAGGGENGEEGEGLREENGQQQQQSLGKVGKAGVKKRKFDDGEEQQQQAETPRKGKRGAPPGAIGDKAGLDAGVVMVEEGPDAGEAAAVATTSTPTGRAPRDKADQWQDRENYDLAQDADDLVDVGNAQRNPAVGGGEDVEEMVGTEGPGGEVVDARRAVAGRGGGHENGNENQQGGSIGVDHEVVHGSGGSKVDKAERKRLKKERSKKEKKTARPR